jgi:hypothetical protein
MVRYSRMPSIQYLGRNSSMSVVDYKLHAEHFWSSPMDRHDRNRSVFYQKGQMQHRRVLANIAASVARIWHHETH